MTVILDGENAWEHYPGGGRPFLRALYRALEQAADVRTVTMSEAAASPARELTSVFPGSWIGGDFYIWAGHGDDHQAWRQLAAARAAFAVAAGRSSEAVERARRELLIAEGSDWFWWYGDDHSSDHDREFDDLFRRHVRNVYQALGLPTPDDLHRTNITTEVQGGLVSFGVLTTPSMDGLARDFTQWSGAVDVPLGGGGAMHRTTDHLVRGLRVAADREHLHIRLDGDDLVRRLRASEVALAVLQDRPQARRLELHHWQAQDVVTVQLPFEALGAHAGDPVSLTILVTDSKGHVLEQHPAQSLVVVVPTAAHEAAMWTV